MQSSELDLLPSPALITSLQGYFITWNKAFEAIDAREDGNDETTHIEAILPIATRVFFQTHIFPMLRQNRSIEEVFFYIKSKDGDKVPVMCNAHQVTYKNEKAYCWVLFIARERQEFEAELIKTKKDVEDANRELSKSRVDLKNTNLELERFVHTVSHDIKAPLVTVEAFSKKLFRDLGKALSEKQTHKFERILLNISHLKRMVDGLLHQTKSSDELDKENVLLSDVMDKLQLLLQSSIEESNAKITIESNHKPIYANRLLLTQCLQNLLSNAIRYRERSRHLIISVLQETQENYDVVHVFDNGIGIHEEDSEKIFSMFQGDNSRQGTGVGLAIVKSTMEKHDGRVSVKSSYGKGAQFTLEFPKRD